MASSLLVLLDDIATLLDDVAIMTKVAAQKTAGVLGDDLAVNAEKVTGVNADRELPVVWAVAKGSLLNKAILVPAALLISALVPWLITPVLMAGGLFLCFEGAEKLLHAFLHSRAEDDAHHNELVQAVSDTQVDLVTFEKNKIKGAIRTDFILSAEIIVITLGTVTGATLLQQLAVLTGVSVLITAGVYGLVAGIVKLDDVGLWMARKPAALVPNVGRMLVSLAPRLMKTLSVLGTVAMFLVGGGILLHGVPTLGHALEQGVQGLGVWAHVASALGAGVCGVLAGAIAVFLVQTLGRLREMKAGTERRH